jgi:hypothetical protein
MPDISSEASNSVREIIWDHVQRSSQRSPISVKETIRQVRRLIPGCPTSDKELASLIGALATAAGRTVHFDGSDDLNRPDDAVH